jgi:hypothetical protein
LSCSFGKLAEDVLIEGMIDLRLVANTQWKAYGDTYRTTLQDWKENGGPSEDQCQYYSGSRMPIMPRSGLVWYLGVGNK